MCYLGMFATLMTGHFFNRSHIDCIDLVTKHFTLPDKELNDPSGEWALGKLKHRCVCVPSIRGGVLLP